MATTEFDPKRKHGHVTRDGRASVCPNCDGTKKLHGTNPCRACNGTGHALIKQVMREVDGVYGGNADYIEFVRTGDIDVVYTSGYGFPRRRGGPVQVSHSHAAPRTARYARMSDEIPVTLRDEQRVALAKFLDLSVLNSFPDGTARYWCTNDRTPYFLNRIGSDADLMSALLDRAVELGYYYETNNGPPHHPQHGCVFWKPDPDFVEYTGIDDKRFDAVVRAALLLPEAQ